MFKDHKMFNDHKTFNDHNRVASDCHQRTASSRLAETHGRKVSLRKQQASLRKQWASVALAGATLVLAGCGSDGSSDSSSSQQSATQTMMSYEISVTNASAGQPLSPLTVMLHDESWQSFETGSTASVALEQMAEAGDNSELLAEAESASEVYAQASGAGIVTPGSDETLELEIMDDVSGTLSISVLSMLVNTNDAFIGLNAKNIASLDVNESIEFDLNTYDAGTEANSETADTVPGPAATGGLREGFNAARDDIRDAVHMHAGVVTLDDGLAESALSQLHRWDNPVARVQITRTQ